MRKIKFRGKQIDGGEWIYGYYFAYEYFGDKKLYHSIVPEKYSSKPADYFHVYPETIGQFTGLTDKCGKEIYEGDILINSIERHYIVEFYKGSFWLKCNETLYSCLLVGECKHLEIIGNIHDTPELLK